MFTVGCQDTSATVSVAAMSATAAYISALSNDPDVMQLQCVITPMLGVMHACLQRGIILHLLKMHLACRIDGLLRWQREKALKK